MTNKYLIKSYEINTKKITYFVVLSQDRQQAIQMFSQAMILYKAIGIKDTDIDVYRSDIAMTAPDVYMMIGRR